MINWNKSIYRSSMIIYTSSLLTVFSFIINVHSLSCYTCEYIDIGSSNSDLDDQLQSYAYGHRDCLDGGDTEVCSLTDDACGKLYSKMTAKIQDDSFHMEMYIRGCTTNGNMTANTCHSSVSDFVNTQSYEATLQFLTGQATSVTVEGDYCVCNDKDNCNTAAHVTVHYGLMLAVALCMTVID